MLDEGRAPNPQVQRLRDTVQTAGFQTTAFNRRLHATLNQDYTLVLPRGYISDQQGSGRCWIFASLNMLRSLLLREGIIDIRFEFSHNYIWFFNFLEQTNRYFEKLVENRGRQFSPRKFREFLTVAPEEGGEFEFFAYLVSKYGLVPLAAMPDTMQSVYPIALIEELSIEMASVAADLKRKLSATVKPNAAELRESKDFAMRRIWTILATHLGDPPKEFDYRVAKIDDPDRDQKIGVVNEERARIKTFTPLKFAADFARVNPFEFVTIWANPRLKTGELYLVKNSQLGKAAPGEVRFDREAINLSPEDLLRVVQESLKGIMPVYAAVDIARDVDHDTGVMHPQIFDRAAIYGSDFEHSLSTLSPEDAIYFRFAQPRHAVLIDGLDQPRGFSDPIKYRMQNSWGYGAGDDGLYHMYSEWARRYLHEIVVHVSVLPKKLRGILKKDPIPLHIKDQW